MSADGYWIRKRERPPRRTGPSTVDGKTVNEMIEEQTEAIRRMSPMSSRHPLEYKSETGRKGQSAPVRRHTLL
jgi:hypothetical protein